MLKRERLNGWWRKTYIRFEGYQIVLDGATDFF